jgi:hypothetical protein
MRSIYTYMSHNVIFGADARDAWALYRLSNVSYPGLTNDRKSEVKNHLEGFAYRIGADFQVMRVSRSWSVEDYFDGAMRTIDPKRGHPRAWRAYLEHHRHVLEAHNTARPETYLAVRLRDANVDLAESVSRGLSSGLGGLVREISTQLGFGDSRGLSPEQLRQIMRLESRAFERVYGYLDCERCSSNDLQWLVRRAYTRGLGEPEIDQQWSPQAIEFPNGDGADRYVPDRAEMLRLHDSLVDASNPRGLFVRSEMGDAYQVLLAVGTLPEQTVFPGPEAELMFATTENLEFPIDITLSAQWIANRNAVKEAHKRKVDADNQFHEEAHGHHGPSAASEERPALARDLEAHLTNTDRPPLLRAGITVALGAPDPETLEERIERVRAEFGRIKLHRAPGVQYRLFTGSLPAQPFAVQDYRDHLTIEQFGAMVPTAWNRAGSEIGPYLGHTITGSRQPILFDLSEANQTSRPPTVFIIGTLGSGKTVLLENLEYQAFLQGSRVIDIDPKGDHNLSALPHIAEHLEEVELGATHQHRGLLDPLRVSPPDMMFDLTVSWLCDLLPSRRDEQIVVIQEAVKTVIANHQAGDRAACCWDVIELLSRSDDPAAQAANRALRVHVDQGLAQLGFASPNAETATVARAQVVSLRVRNLRPARATERAELTQEELISQAVLRLLAVFAMHAMTGNRAQHKVLSLDEGWFLLQNASVGQRLLEQMFRWGRSENATPIVATHLASDARGMDNLIGARFMMGMESDEEARCALELLGLDPQDSERRHDLTKFRKGCCLFRDYEGDVARIQVHVPDPSLLSSLDTTPHRESGPRAERPSSQSA